MSHRLSAILLLLVAVQLRAQDREADQARLAELADQTRAMDEPWILANRLNQPSVVAISTRERRPIIQWNQRIVTQEIPSGEGSGFVVASDAQTSWLVTNAHVVVRTDAKQEFLRDRRTGQPIWHDRIQVDLDTGGTVDATPVGADLQTDLAVLRIPVPQLPTVSWADSDTIQIGTQVMALGFPFGVGYTATRGMISGTGRETSGGVTESYENFLQTDAAINPGNSGGPLIDLRGQVVGVNASIYNQTGANIGIGFAIPANLARRVADDLIDDGVVSRPVVGLHVWTLSEEEVSSLAVPNRKAVKVTMVIPGSPAAEVGVRIGDVILDIDGDTLTSLQHFRSKIAASRLGQELHLGLWREGRRVEFVARPIGREDLERQLREEAGRRVSWSNFGLEFEQDEQPGLRIDRVEPDSPAAAAGLQAGDRVYGILGHGAVQSLDQIADLDRRSSLVLEVYHQGRLYLIRLQR